MKYLFFLLLLTGCANMVKAVAAGASGFGNGLSNQRQVVCTSKTINDTVYTECQ